MGSTGSGTGIDLTDQTRAQRWSRKATTVVSDHIGVVESSGADPQYPDVGPEVRSRLAAALPPIEGELDG